MLSQDNEDAEDELTKPASKKKKKKKKKRVEASAAAAHPARMHDEGAREPAARDTQAQPATPPASWPRPAASVPAHCCPLIAGWRCPPGPHARRRRRGAGRSRHTGTASHPTSIVATPRRLCARTLPPSYCRLALPTRPARTTEARGSRLTERRRRRRRRHER